MRIPILCCCLLTTALLSFPSVAADDTWQVKPETVEKIKAALPQTAPAKPQQPRRLLVFSKTSGFRHDSIPVGVKAITLLGEQTGAFTAVHSEDDAVFEPQSLQSFDAVLMLNTTGEVFRPQQVGDDPAERRAAQQREQRLQQSLVDFVRSGKGLAGVHSATDTYRDWKAYNDMMGGAFVSHPWHTEVPVRVLDPGHPLLKVFGGKGFTVVDEIYQFRNDTAKPTERRMLLSLAPEWEGLQQGSRDDDFYPISWIDRYGQGRVFYCSLGHRDEIFHNPEVMAHYLAGLQFALGDLEADAEPIEIRP
jgi:type 1 glutamine amidotransferase